MVSTLNDLGFHHLRPVFDEGDSALCPFLTAEKYEANVFSYNPAALIDFDKLLVIQAG